MAVACESCGHSHDGWVPKDRLDKVAQKLKAAQTEHEEALAAATSEAEQLRTAVAEAGKAGETLEQAQARIAELEQRAGSLTQERAIIRAGITDDEGIGVVGALYSAMPEEQRPASVEEWLQAGNLPRAVLAYLPQTPAAPAGEEAAAPPAGAPPAAPPRTASTSRGVVHGEPPARTAIDVNSMPIDQLKELMGRLQRQ